MAVRKQPLGYRPIEAPFANVGLERDDGTIEFVRLQRDAVPTLAGRMLIVCYDTPDKLTQLLKVGDLQTLREVSYRCTSVARSHRRDPARCVSRIARDRTNYMIRSRIESCFAYLLSKRGWLVIYTRAWTPYVWIPLKVVLSYPEPDNPLTWPIPETSVPSEA